MRYKNKNVMKKISEFFSEIRNYIDPRIEGIERIIVEKEKELIYLHLRYDSIWEVWEHEGIPKISKLFWVYVCIMEGYCSNNNIRGQYVALTANKYGFSSNVAWSSYIASLKRKYTNIDRNVIVMQAAFLFKLRRNKYKA